MGKGAGWIFRVAREIVKGAEELLDKKGIAGEKWQGIPLGLEVKIERIRENRGGGRLQRC